MEKGSSLSINPGKEEVKFRKEPDFGKDKVLRRALVIGPGIDDFIGLAVDVSRRTLYVDLNRNLDLTDDPLGIFKASGATGSLYFGNVRLNLSKDGVNRSYLLRLYLIGSTISSVSVASCYQGDIELQGKKWRLTLRDNLDDKIDRRDMIAISPIDGGRAVPINDSMPAPRRLVLGGVHYEVVFTYQSSAVGPSSVRAQFKEIQAPTAELVLDGGFIRRLVLDGEQGTAVLDSPARSILLPVDRYRVQSLSLQTDPVKPRLSTDASQIPQFAMSAGKPFHLKIGGPLASGVKVTSRGSMLQLDYILKGAGGERYSINSTSGQSAPAFSIYRGDRRMASGKFQYG